MMNFKQLRPEGSDCTAPYEVTNFPEVVSDFVNEVLTTRNKEWGKICIGDLFTDKCYKYRYGELEDTIPSEILESKIKNITSFGGWTNMDYVLELHKR